MKTVGLAWWLSGVIAHSAIGQCTVTGDRSAWEASHPGARSVSFNDLPSGTVVTDQYLAEGLSFAGPNTRVLEDATRFPSDTFGLFDDEETISGRIILVSLSQPATAFAVTGVRATLIEVYDTGNNLLWETPMNTGTARLPFVGIQCTEPFQSLRIVSFGSEVSCNDLFVVDPPSGWAAIYPRLLPGAEDVRILRRFRDTHLQATTQGRGYVAALYRHSEAARQVLLKHPALLREAARLYASNRASLQAVMAGDFAQLNDVETLCGFLERCEKAAPTKLAALIRTVRHDLLKSSESGRPFFGFTLP